MGRSTTPRYVVRYRGNVVLTPAAWRTRATNQIPADGKPTPDRLKKHVEELNKSFNPGGVNEHVSRDYVAYVYGAVIVDQFNDDAEVARYDAPMFNGAER